MALPAGRHNWLPPAVGRGDYQDHYNKSESSDVTLRFGDKEVKVHKVILEASSKFFTNMFSEQWKDDTNPVFTLDEDEPQVLVQSLLFLYGWDIAKMRLEHLMRTAPPNTDPDIAIYHPYIEYLLDVYRIADYYDFSSVTLYVVNKFKELYHDGHFQLNNYSINIVIKSTLPLSDMLRKTVAAFYIAATAKDRFVANPEMEALLRDNPQFGTEVAIQKMKLFSVPLTPAIDDKPTIPATICGEAAWERILKAAKAECKPKTE